MATVGRGTRIVLVALLDPARPNRPMTFVPSPGTKFTAIQIEICPGRGDTRTWSEGMWTVQSTDGRSWLYWNVDDYALAPRFGSRVIQPGQCEQGWITYETPVDTRVDGARWHDNETTKRLQWTQQG